MYCPRMHCSESTVLGTGFFEALSVLNIGWWLVSRNQKTRCGWTKPKQAPRANTYVTSLCFFGLRTRVQKSKHDISYPPTVVWSGSKKHLDVRLGLYLWQSPDEFGVIGRGFIHILQSSSTSPELVCSFGTSEEHHPIAGVDLTKVKSTPLYSFLLKEAGLGEAWDALEQRMLVFSWVPDMFPVLFQKHPKEKNT